MKSVIEQMADEERRRRGLADMQRLGVRIPRDTPVARSPVPLTLPIKPVTDPREPERLALPVREMRCSHCGASEVSRLIPPLCEHCISDWGAMP